MQIYLSFSFPSRVNKCLVNGLSSVIGMIDNALVFIFRLFKKNCSYARRISFYFARSLVCEIRISFYGNRKSF